MSDQQHQGGAGFAQHGPAWIASITAVVAMVALVVVLAVTRSGSSEPTSAKPSANDNTVAVDPTTAGEPSDSGTSSDLPVTPPAVFWSGELRIRDSIESDAGFSFDVTPPRYVEDHSIALFDGELGGYDGVLLAEWTSNGVPTWTECGDQVTNEGTDWTGSLSDGSVVCGRTLEGRIFRIEANHFDDADINATVTVWAP